MFMIIASSKQICKRSLEDGRRHASHDQHKSFRMSRSLSDLAAPRRIDLHKVNLEHCVPIELSRSRDTLNLIHWPLAREISYRCLELRPAISSNCASPAAQDTKHLQLLYRCLTQRTQAGAALPHHLPYAFPRQILCGMRTFIDPFRDAFCSKQNRRSSTRRTLAFSVIHADKDHKQFSAIGIMPANCHTVNYRCELPSAEVAEDQNGLRLSSRQAHGLVIPVLLMSMFG